MGYRDRTQIVGRAQPPIPMATTEAERTRIAQCVVVEAIAPHGRPYRQIKDVFKDGQLIGQARYVMNGMEFRFSESEEWLSAGHDWNPADPRYCLAILRLLKEQD